MQFLHDNPCGLAVSVCLVQSLSLRQHRPAVQDLRKFFEKQAKSKKFEQRRSSKFETRTEKDGSKIVVETERHRGGHGGDDHIQVRRSHMVGQEGSELEIKVETRSTKGILNESRLVFHTGAKDSRITGIALTDGAIEVLLKKFGIPRDKVIIKDGQVIAKEWDVNPNSRPGTLPGVDQQNSGSISWGSLIQTVLYLQAGICHMSLNADSYLTADF